MGNDSVKAELAKTTSESLVPRSGATEIMATAAAAQVKAMVEARFVMALNRQRVMEQVRLDLLKECQRPSFALEDIKGKGNSALYKKPVGGGRSVEGLGIRFAEVAVRCLGNVMADSFAIQESSETIEKYCFVLDLEKNNSWGDTVKISKTVERREPREGDEILKKRVNSQGQDVFVIVANEDALITKEAALVSKKMRTLILRMVPGDLQDECIYAIKETREKEIAEDPDAALRRVLDLLAQQNIGVTQVEAFLKHPVSQISPPEILNLQSLYGSLRDEETTWAEIMENADELRKTKKDEGTKETRGNEAAKKKVNETAAKVKPATTTATVTKDTPAKDVCSKCGATDEALTDTPDGLLCNNCKPRQAPVTKEEAPGKKALPWETEKAETVAEEPAQEKSLEDKVAQMAAAKPAAPAQSTKERKKPKLAEVKKVKMPEFVDRLGDDDAPTDEQIARMKELLGKIPGYDTEGKITVGLANTVLGWTGASIDEINTETAAAIITVLENWK